MNSVNTDLVNNSSKIFGIIKLRLFVISQRLKFLKDDRTDTNFIAPFNIHFWSSKSTIESLKSVFNVFRRKPSLVAPDLMHQTSEVRKSRRRVALDSSRSLSNLMGTRQQKEKRMRDFIRQRSFIITPILIRNKLPIFFMSKRFLFCKSFTVGLEAINIIIRSAIAKMQHSSNQRKRSAKRIS